MESKSNLQLDTSLLPQYQEFRTYNNDNHDLSLWNYLCMVGSYEMAAALSKLFWPDFVEVQGCVLLAEHFDEALLKRVKLPQERQGFEASVNHVHIWDLFLNDSGRAFVQLELDEYLAKTLSVMWKHALKEAFPDKEFEFYYATEPDEYGPTITFHQKDSSG